MNNKGFVEAGELKVGNELVDVNNNILLIEDYTVEITEEPTTVYNFQVEDFHTYFVGECCIWVHNAQCPVPEAEKATNGLNYKSNPKHTQGQPGNRPNAGIEPKNSFELFEKSQPSTIKPNQRYTYDKLTKTLHRFFLLIMKAQSGMGVVQQIKVEIHYVLKMFLRI